MDAAALVLHRLHFAFTVTFHYLFPQLTMGLALLIFILKLRAYRSSDDRYHKAAQFWTRIFAINFAFGVVTGIPMEFQFGTNWSRFSKTAGGVIGQTLAMEGVYSFFLESTFLGILLYGERRVGRFLHLMAALGVLLGSWLSGFFINRPRTVRGLFHAKLVPEGLWHFRIFHGWDRPLKADRLFHAES